MDERIELVVLSVERLVPVASRLRTEEVLDTAPESDDVPWKLAGRDDLAHAVLESFPELDHALERLVGHHLAERGAHRREGERVAGERASRAADVDHIGVGALDDAPLHVLRHAVGGRWDTGPEGLADRHDVGCEAPRLRRTTGPRADRVGLVDQQEGPGLIAEIPDALPVARV